MVTFFRKAAERDPASTAALSRVGISLRSQRRVLHHPAGALTRKSSAEGMKRIGRKL